MEMKNNEHTLDKTVRQALENLEIPFNADHWELMVGKLDALNVEDVDFDTHIASKLTGVEVPYVAANWLSMSEQLDKLDAEDLDFDKNLAHKLANIEVPYSSANWADMSDRLNELDNTETAFDALIRQRLDNVKPNMPDNHWALMEDKIEEAFSWRRKIMRYKVVEVALILLTLFTVGNAIDLPFDSVRSTDNSASPKIEATILKGKNGDLKKTTPAKAKETKSFYNPTDWRNRPATPNNNVKTEQNTPNKPIVSTDNIDAVSNPVAVGGINNVEKKAVDILSNNIAVQPTNEVKNESYNNPISKEAEITAQTTVATTNTSTENIVNPDNLGTEGGKITELPLRKVSALGKVTDGFEKAEDVAAIAATELNPMDILKPSLLNTQVYDENIIFPKQKEKKAKWRLNAFVLPIADFVTSYSIQFRNKDVQNQKVANLGAGIAAGYKKDKLEVEMGLSYLDKKYDLPNVEFTTGNLRNGYTTVKPDNLHLSIVSIPLSINYVAKETRRWSFYTRVGAAINTILKSEGSQFVTKTDPNSSAYIDPNYSGNNNTAKIDINIYEPNVYPKGIREKNFFKDGKWINGGLRENTYLTTNVGVGLEYRFSNKIDIYLQPTFDYHFGRGIGTLNDRVHSFSVQGGVKTKLK
jgi:hypothetical protein